MAHEPGAETHMAGEASGQLCALREHLLSDQFLRAELGFEERILLADNVGQ